MGDSESNIYTVLMFVASLLLLAAVVYVWVRHGVVFGSYNPFSLDVAAPMTDLLRTLR